MRKRNFYLTALSTALAIVAGLFLLCNVPYSYTTGLIISSIIVLNIAVVDFRL